MKQPTWKAFLLRLPVYLVLIAVVGVGIWNWWKQFGLPEPLQEVLPTQPPPAEQGIPPEKLVKNILSIGDTFSVYPWEATGHLDCKVLSARFVNEEADCPREWLIGEGYLEAYNDEHGSYVYDEWFLPGGPLEQGARLVNIELEVTNVDAVANVQVGDFDPAACDAYYREPDLFDGYNLLVIADLGTMDSYGNSSWYHTALFSETGKYAPEDDVGTVGNERYALKLAPGETKQITLIISVPSTFEHTARDPEYLFLLNYQSIDLHSIENDIRDWEYIDLNLEDIP